MSGPSHSPRRIGMGIGMEVITDSNMTQIECSIRTISTTLSPPSLSSPQNLTFLSPQSPAFRRRCAFPVSQLNTVLSYDTLEADFLLEIVCSLNLELQNESGFMVPVNGSRLQGQFDNVSFQNKGSWMAKGGGHLTDGDAAYDNPSRVEPKRSHQWFADANEPELFPNKKQAVQTPNGKSTAGILNGNPPPLGTPSSFFPSVPSQFMDRLFGGETDRPFDFTEQNISSVGTDDSSMRKNCVNNQHGNDSSVSLSISNAIENPEICLSYGGVRKINGYQIKDSDSGFHVPEEHNRGSDQAYNQGNETDYISMGKGYSKEDESVMLMGHTYKGNSNIRSMGYAFEKGDDSNISIGHGYNKEGFNALSFGSFQEEEPDIDPLARPLSSYEFTFDQSSVQISETPSVQISETPNGPNINEVDASTAIALPISKVAKPRPDSASKNKSEQKVTRKEKEAPNSFPWNVKTLISTGILDGVPVKYIAVSREVLNAHEYERHAGCKTKHPNNHIYFENGKSTYQVVQELRSIPETQLYDAIQTATGSPINQKAFLTWKESFQAATRELQRIYGKEDLHS
ncbi:hypothetical protein RHGRI_002426 [Rhododendron griersonianum]|uniref:Tify domain-containing protein n=1 Tax=Rhododendron griersonianum TaxID=479676 RepID=A0AAV6LS82_9ERIC|nr:hypothetical protein RHGRI_002426 [Rhododendron griersonianum]